MSEGKLEVKNRSQASGKEKKGAAATARRDATVTAAAPINPVASPQNDAHLVRLHQELAGLFAHLNRLRDELAAIKNPAIEDLHFSRTGSQLQAIVAATEQATNAIMESVEKNEELVTALRGQIKAPAQGKILDQISANNFAVLEACSFQDITGQRVNKVIKFVTHVEGRIDALCEIWGLDGIARAPVNGEDTRSDDEKLLRGPALKNEGVSQKDIDALFD